MLVPTPTMPNTELCGPLVLRLCYLKRDPEIRPQKGAGVRSVFSYTGQGRSQSQHLSRTGFFSSGASCSLLVQYKQIDHAFPTPTARLAKRGEINGFPVQQRPSCKAAEFNMQTPPPRPQTPILPAGWTGQLEPHNVWALRLLGPSYYSLGFSIIR